MFTTYHEVTADDRDVAAFIASRPLSINLLALPAKMWVARYGPRIVAVMMLNTAPYLSIDVEQADRSTRSFVRLYKLYQMVEAWLRIHEIPAVCITITNTDAHFQSIIRRLGYVKAGVEVDDNGNEIETVFMKTLTSARKVA